MRSGLALWLLVLTALGCGDGAGTGADAGRLEAGADAAGLDAAPGPDGPPPVAEITVDPATVSGAVSLKGALKPDSP